ncbi:MAG: DMT family transporter [Acidiferrobacterales bacterium]|nr:DMT family transporter [Acidiferrobacterales bacterium]
MQFLARTSQNFQGILCLFIALVFLTISDAIIKWLSPYYPLHELTLIKAAIALVLILVFAHFFGGLSQLKTKRPWLHILRGFMLVLSDAFYFLGLAAMPMATAVALFFCAPLFVCLIAKMFLGETVGLQRWLAIVVGMVGVLVIAQPGGVDFNWSVIFPVLSAVTYALMIMMTRKLAISDSAGSMSVYILISFIMLSTISGFLIGDGRFNVFSQASLDFLLRAWLWPSLSVYQLLIICGVVSAVGVYLLSQSYRIAEASVVVPFEYASLPLAILAGLLVWGDVPGLRDYIGSALIIGSGLVVVLLEIRMSRKIALSKVG